MRNQLREKAAIKAANFLRKKFNIQSGNPIGIVLGTGWGDKLVIEILGEVFFEEVPGFSKLAKLEGHDRKFIYGMVEDKEVVVLKGRIHLNEDPGNSEIYKMVRLQIETLMQLGVNKLVTTCAAGALPGTELEPGNIVLINGFMTLSAPQMPLWAGEFTSPEDTLSEGLRNIALKQRKNYGSKIKMGGYAMVLGPYFEGRNYDKKALSNTGAVCVGMSTLPEACIVGLYPECSLLSIAFITNDAFGVHSHEANIKKAGKFSVKLGKYLARVIKKI